MARQITVKNLDTGLSKKAYTGFSWTMLFFGFFAPLIRGDLKTSLIYFVLMICTSWTVIIPALIWLIYPFKWNAQHLEALNGKGYVSIERYEDLRVSKKREHEEIIDAIKESK